VLRVALVIATVAALGLGATGADGGRPHVDPILVWCGDCHAYQDAAGLYTMRPDGTHFRFRLRDFHQARWSPDGDRLVLAGLEARPGIWTAGPDGLGIKRLTAWKHDSSPTWSPDGRRIIFVHSRNYSTRIWMISAAGGRKHAVVPKDIGEEQDPDWSPRGDRIAFSHTRVNYGESDGDLFVVRPDGTGLRRLRHAGITPRWSPDGTRLAYLIPGLGDDQFGVRVLTLRTNRVRRYAVRLKLVAPVWSPDGKSLLVNACLPDSPECMLDNVSRLRLRDGHVTVLRNIPLGGPLDWRR
jgi:hypothetical protein